MSGNMNDDEFNSSVDLSRRQQERFVAVLNSDGLKSYGDGLTKFSNLHTNPDEKVSESNVEDYDESLIRDYDGSLIGYDDESQWDDSDYENDLSSVNDKVSFQRVDSKPNLTSRHSLLTTLMHEDNRAQALQNAKSRSTPGFRRSRATSPKRPSNAALPNIHALQYTPTQPEQEVPRSNPITMTTSNTQAPPALSPRVTRRNMLATELPESLRRQLLWERQEKTSTNTVALKGRHSSTDATQSKSTTPSVPPASVTVSSRRASSRSTTSDDAGNSFKFVTTSRPEEFEDPELMRTVRSHVMFGVVEGRQRVPPRAKKSSALPNLGASIRGESSSTTTTAPKRTQILGRSDSAADADPDDPQFMGRKEALDIFQKYHVPRSSASTFAGTPALPKQTLAQRGKLPARYDQSRRIGADELLEDSITKAKDASEKSKIVGQVDTSDHASEIGHEGSLLTNSPANLLSGVSVSDILPIHAATSIDAKKRNSGELTDIPFPDDSPVQDRGIGGVHSEQDDVSTSQEIHQSNALDPVPAQSTYGVPHFARDGHTQAGLDERGLVESNHAISYVKNIKNRFATQPGIYNQFLEILRAYQRDSMPAKDFHAQLTQLLNSAPDLLEGLEQLVPGTAAQHSYGHSDLPATEAANLQDPRVYDSIGCTGPNEPAFEHDSESLTRGSPSDKSFSHAVETADSSNEVKKYIVESLMQKVYDLLGYGPSGVSESNSSPESSSDGDVKESINWPAPSHGERSTAAEPYSNPADAGTSSQVQSQSKRTNTGTRNSESTRSRSLSAGKLTGKRKQRTGDEPDDEGEEKGNSGRGGPRPPKSSRHGPRFACPFYKRRPEVHGRNSSCLWPGFNTISRLKEHLYRVHLSNVEGDNICPRCRETFDSSLSLVRHLARAERCMQVVVPEQEDGLDEDQILQLRNRDRGTEPEDKWRHIYRICHRLPDDAETPWPYCDQESPANQAVEGYDWYQRQHLPNLIREHLEREPEIRIFVERFGDRLPAIIRECQMNLHRRFTSPRTAVDSANEPGLAVDSDQPTVQPPNGRADQHPVPPPVAFEAPPNTDNGMTSSEAQQVHAMSSQKNRNSDSGYGSAVFEPHQPVELRKHGHSDPGIFSSGDAPVSGIFPDEPQHLQGSHHLQDPGIVDVIQSSSVQSTEEGVLLGEAGRHQMLEWVDDFSSATIDGQQMVAQNQNSANNPDDGIWGVAIDWPELDGDDSIDWPKLDGNNFTFGN